MRVPASVLVFVFVIVVISALVSGTARAFEEFEGTRASAMGGATRAYAVGDSGPLLNPSGMALTKSYNVEASYAYGSRLTEQFLHASIVDSTSQSTVAGGLYYTYRLDNPPGPATGRGHEVGGSLAVPLGSYLSVGATLKWFRLEGVDQGPNLSSGGTTFDVGLTVRPTANLSLAVVGANLRDRHAGQVPQTLSYGLAYSPSTAFIVALDGLTSYTRDDVLGARGTGVKAGIEWALAQRVAVRAGGGTDPMLGVGYVAGGVSALSEVGAVDLGVRGDVIRIDAGSERNLFVGLSVRLFVGAQGTSGGPTEPPSSDPLAEPSL
jgi:hypothetical protein